MGEGLTRWRAWQTEAGAPASEAAWTITVDGVVIARRTEASAAREQYALVVAAVREALTRRPLGARRAVALHGPGGLAEATTLIPVWPATEPPA